MDEFFKSDNTLPSSDELEGLGCGQIEEEAEYDALNEETFGTEALEGDWEQDHEKLAILTEQSRSALSKINLEDNSDIEAEISQLVLDSPEPEESSNLSTNATVNSETPLSYSWIPPWQGLQKPPPIILLNQPLTTTKSVQTVEELERNLLQQRENRELAKNNNTRPHHPSGIPPIGNFFHNSQTPCPPNIGPGLGPSSILSHGEIHHHTPHRQIFVQNQRYIPRDRDHHSNYRNQNDSRRNYQGQHLINYQYHQNHHHPHENHHNQHSLNQQNHYFYNNQQRNHNNQQQGYRYDPQEYDEYAGLMSTREKQWLLNIQTMQISSDNPYVDDYYYLTLASKKPGWGKNRLTERKDNQRDQPLKTYIPTQFENSLGKLQVGSVTAPRKIIDMELIAKENLETISYLSSHESKKTKQYLLELEKLYTFLLKLEDISSNIQELKILVNENKQEIILKIISGLSNDDLLCTSFGIRKGKAFLIRFLPHLMESESYKNDIMEIWSKLFRNFYIIQRRDINHQILPRFYGIFKEFIMYKSTLTDLIQLVKMFNEKNLQSAMTNSFGISAIIRIIIQFDDYNNRLKIKPQVPEWQQFISNLVEVCEEIDQENIAQPLEAIPFEILATHLEFYDSIQIHTLSKLEEILSINDPNVKNVH